jgi:quinohemoprotein ethanol dehydrogenase
LRWPGRRRLAAAREAPGRPAAVDSARMAKQGVNGADWLHDGRPTAPSAIRLTQINADNVDRLGIAWYDELDTYRGVEATPLYADGVLTTSCRGTSPLPMTPVPAGLWTYDPKVPREYGRYACCEPVARGLALWKRKVIIATLDGRLIGLDARSGTPVWETQTVPKDMPYTITGAPRVFDGKVVVGNAGGDLGVRGFVSAYDAETGRKLWKFFLTPNPAGEPDGEASDAIMGMIQKTWSDGLWSNSAVGPTPGTAWPTTRNSTRSMSAPATARPGTRKSAARAAATTSTCRPSSRSIPTPASTSGTTRPRRARLGTTPPHSPSCSPI